MLKEELRRGKRQPPDELVRGLVLWRKLRWPAFPIFETPDGFSVQSVGYLSEGVLYNEDSRNAVDSGCRARGRIACKQEHEMITDALWLSRNSHL